MQELETTTPIETLTGRIAALIEAGRTGVARPLLVAARRMAPPSPGLAQLSAMLAIREGRLDDARCELDEAIATAPREPSLRKCRAGLL
jgi:Flp pilus assembly protein TadD